METWKVVGLEIPDYLKETREKINEVAEFLLLILDIALAALNIVKVFVSMFLNPLGAILAAIIAEINALIRDLRNIGLYLAGDWNLLEYPFIDLQGGFNEYERRMVARLSDRTDPTRPDVSSRTKVLGMFFYVSADSADVAKLIRFIRTLLKFFNQEIPSSGLPVPVIDNVLYGAGIIGNGFPTMASITAAFQASTTPPNLARVRWKLSPADSKNPKNTLPALPPAGFMISVSTVPWGLQLYYDRPQSSDTKKESSTGEQVQPREYGPVLDGAGNPIVLYGGTDEFVLPLTLQYNWGTKSTGAPFDGSVRVWAALQGQASATNTPIALERLYAGTTYMLQRRFFVETSVLNLNWKEEGFYIDLPLEDLPHHATFSLTGGQVAVEDLGLASTYYVRVASVSAVDGFVYDFNKANDTSAWAGPFKVPFVDDEDPAADKSPWSDAVTVTYPNSNTDAYFTAIETALAVLILSRSDLPLLEDVLSQGSSVLEAAKNNKLMIPGVALTPTGLEDFQDLFNRVYEDFQSELLDTTGNPKPFRRNLRRRIHRAAKDMYERTGTLPEIERRVVEATTNLRGATWGQILSGNPDSRIRDMGNTLNHQEEDFLSLIPQPQNPTLANMTIMDALDSLDGEFGLAISPFAVGADTETVEKWRAITDPRLQLILGRKPSFIEVDSREADQETFAPIYVAAPEDTPILLEEAHPALRMFYEKFIEPDGSLLIPHEASEYLQVLEARGTLIGSADTSPVYYTNRTSLLNVTTASPVSNGRVAFVRTLLTQYNSGVILSEARVALTMAASVLRRPANDGEWLAFRLFDMLPFIEDFLETINRWIKAISDALKGIAEAILKFIGFLEARIIETQQLIRRINALLQSLLLFNFPVGARALMLSSDGTDGLLADFVAAGGRPSDTVSNLADGSISPEGPFTYGGGIALVAPLAPAFLIDLFKMEDDPNSPNLAVVPPTSAFTPEALPPAPVIGPDFENEEPDVL